MRCLGLFGFFCLALGACQPPATETYAERGNETQLRTAPGEPIGSLDTENAIWSPAKSPDRILYGTPGQAPLLAIACERDTKGNNIRITRYVATDPEAKAIMALIGNGHRARLPIDAVWNGKGWLWEANYPADLPDLDVFTGLRAIEVTVPGAGTVTVNPSPLPLQLVERCREVPEASSQE